MSEIKTSRNGHSRRIHGIIFDMDNTLLQSTIDFVAMKLDISTYLGNMGALPVPYIAAQHTSATLIEHAKQQGLSGEHEKAVWEIASKHELLGMQDAGLEPEVESLLSKLQHNYTLVVVTNNSLKAANRALESTGISSYFDLVVGRELVASIKPSPVPFHYVLKHFPHIMNSEWLSVGDSWIDGAAAKAAGIPFISYQTRLELMEARGVKALGVIEVITGLTDYLE